MADRRPRCSTTAVTTTVISWRARRRFQRPPPALPPSRSRLPCQAAAIRAAASGTAAAAAEEAVARGAGWRRSPQRVTLTHLATMMPKLPHLPITPHLPAGTATMPMGTVQTTQRPTGGPVVRPNTISLMRVRPSTRHHLCTPRLLPSARSSSLAAAAGRRRHAVSPAAATGHWPWASPADLAPLVTTCPIMSPPPPPSNYVARLCRRRGGCMSLLHMYLHALPCLSARSPAACGLG